MEPEYRLPEDVDCERTLLASMLAFPDSPEVPEILGFLVPDAFIHPVYRAAFMALCSLLTRHEEVNLITLKGECEALGLLNQAGGYVGLAECTHAAEVLHPVVLARRLYDLWARRQMVRTASRALQRVVDTTVPLTEVLQEIQGRFLPDLRGPRRLVNADFGGVAMNSIDPVDWLIPGVLQRGAVGVFGAQPGTGKSYMAIMLLIAVATGKPSPWGPSQRPSAPPRGLREPGGLTPGGWTSHSVRDRALQILWRVV